MKSIVKTLLVTAFSAVLFVSCGAKGVAGKTYTLKIDDETASISFAKDGTFKLTNAYDDTVDGVYVFSQAANAAICTAEGDTIAFPVEFLEGKMSFDDVEDKQSDIMTKAAADLSKAANAATDALNAAADALKALSE